jgi:hypothetical protein
MESHLHIPSRGTSFVGYVTNREVGAYLQRLRILRRSKVNAAGSVYYNIIISRLEGTEMGVQFVTCEEAGVRHRRGVNTAL